MANFTGGRYRKGRHCIKDFNRKSWTKQDRIEKENGNQNILDTFMGAHISFVMGCRVLFSTQYKLTIAWDEGTDLIH
jgi:hypothetical protein